MEVLSDTVMSILKIIIGFVVAFVGISFWINGLTGWGDHGNYKKLWFISGLATLFIVALYYIIF